MVVTLRNVASSTSLNWKMKHFYESCMNLDNIETDEGKPLKKIISTILGMFCSSWVVQFKFFLCVLNNIILFNYVHTLGGWHVLKDFNVHEWDVTSTIVQLHSKYSVSPFFKIDVVPDDKVSGQNIIQVLLSVLLLFHYSGWLSYKMWYDFTIPDISSRTWFTRPKVLL